MAVGSSPTHSNQLWFVSWVRLKPIFQLATLFAGCQAKTRIRKRDWLKFRLFSRTNSPSGNRLNDCVHSPFSDVNRDFQV